MRKVTATIKFNFLMKKMIGSIFKKFEYVELKELMQVDFDTGVKIGVGDIKVKPGIKLTKEKIGSMEILDILKIKENVYTCLVKVVVPKAGQKMLKFFDFDLLYDIPT